VGFDVGLQSDVEDPADLASSRQPTARIAHMRALL
jgi:hypothetical protein